MPIVLLTDLPAVPLEDPQVVHPADRQVITEPVMVARAEPGADQVVVPVEVLPAARAVPTTEQFDTRHLRVAEAPADIHQYTALRRLMEARAAVQFNTHLHMAP